MIKLRGQRRRDHEARRRQPQRGRHRAGPRSGLPRRRTCAAMSWNFWRSPMEKAGSEPRKIGNPLWVNAEITYKCPLHCVFCYNPTDYTQYGPELTTEEWLRVLRQARELGAVQLGISGGEPLMRDDVEIMVAEASRLGYYVNLITSGIGLTEKRIAAFNGRRAGADPALVPGLDAGDERLPVQHQDLRAQVEGRQADQAVRLPDGAQRGAASDEHRSHPADPGDGRGDGRRARRARQHAVLRLGHGQPRPVAAQPRAAGARRGRSPTSSAPASATR